MGDKRAFKIFRMGISPKVNVMVRGKIFKFVYIPIVAQSSTFAITLWVIPPLVLSKNI